MSNNDPESQYEKPHRKRSENTRWHHHLHPGVIKESAKNSFPESISWIFHSTHAILVGKDGARQAWTSRDHRKRRHVSTSPRTERSRHGSTLLLGLSHMFRIEYWNISWWVAQAFTWGSVVWVINGFASFLPFCNSSFQKAPNSSGWTAFIGATIFEFGSVLGMWEAWNREDTANFGWGIRNTFNNSANEASRRGTFDDPSGDTLEVRTTEENFDANGQRKKWIWFSADPRYFRELGFLAAFFQLLAASIFWISGFTAIPQIQETLEDHTAALNGAFWTPQVIGGMGFVISATFIMLEAQKVWWKPHIASLGWQVGVWNFIGGIGFTLCGALGYAASSSGAEYQSSLSTFWGGWAFLIGSIIQWYESVNSV